MQILLIQMDGKFPNLALMRISAHHKERGDTVTLRHLGNLQAIECFPFHEFDMVYASLIFFWNKPVAERLLAIRPDAIVGGTGWDLIPNGSDDGLVNIRARQEAARISKVENHGILTKEKDYSLYPNFTASIGFTQRGCRMACTFCGVPVLEGKVKPDESIASIWRGGSNPKNLIIWDNDTFGAKDWRETFAAIRDGGYRVSFNQGINARLMNEENAEAFAATPCYDDDFKTRRWYTAWDSRGDEEILFRGLRYMVKYGIKPDQIMVYMLMGYWPGETSADRDYRRQKLRNFGVRPYPMVWNRSPHGRCKCAGCIARRELTGFQRWVIYAYDKTVPWKTWQAADYRPEKLGLREKTRDQIWRERLDRQMQLALG